MPDRKPGEAVLLMGYGAPQGPEDLPGFLQEVLGRPPSPALVEEYRRRYELIGWSPQLRIIQSLRQRLEDRFTGVGSPRRVLLGTKHWTPHVADAVRQAADEGIRRLVAIPLSPFASPWVLRPYQRELETGRSAASHPIAVELRAGWHRSKALARFWADELRSLPRSDHDGSVVFLTAHSLPERHRRSGDPYPEIIGEMVQEVVREADLKGWEFTYQSAGNTTEPWLGPDVRERMQVWAEKGAKDQWIASLGFLFDHLEVLYDLDVVVRAFAEEHGIRYHRLPQPNDDPRVVEALQEVADAPSWPLPVAV